jgi:hypothetical protein
MSDKGSITNPGVQLRDIIRGQAARESRAVDQVALGTVANVGDGATVEILLDGFSAGALEATWATPVAPAVDQRVAVLSLKGGQNFFVTGVLPTPSLGATDHGSLFGLGDDDHPQYVLVTDGIDGLGDVTITTASEGDVLRWRTSEWVNEQIGLDGLGDVTISGPTTGDALMYSGTAWVDRPLVEADISDLQTYALVSDLADYLPLAGGTMTGALTMDDLGFNVPQTGGTGQGTLLVKPSGADNGWYAYWSGGPGTAARGRLDFFGNGSDLLDLSFDGQLLAADGSVSTPSFAFDSQSGTGIYRIGTARIGFSGNGTHMAEFNAGTLRSASTATGSPSLTFGTATGSQSAPVYSFQGDTQLGHFRVAAGVAAMVSGGVWNAGWSSQGLYAGNGSAASPSVYFYNDTSMGIYAHNTTTHILGISRVGTQFALIANTGMHIYGTDPYTTQHAWLTLQPPTTGGNYDDGSAGISIGESGYLGSASMHLIYTGDGYGRIGTGTVTLGAAATMPAYTRISMVYNNLTWYQDWSLLYVSSIYYDATAYGVVRVNTGGAGTTARVSQNSYTSSRKYKRKIKTHSVEDSPFLGYRPVSYRLRKHPDTDFIDNLDYQETKYGFILEEVKEAGVAEKRIEKHPHTGEDHGLFYDSWQEELVADHTALVKDYLELKRRVANLEMAMT